MNVSITECILVISVTVTVVLQLLEVVSSNVITQSELKEVLD